MNKKIKRLSSHFVLIIYIGFMSICATACGSSPATSNQPGTNPTTTGSTNDFETNLSLTFHLTLTIDSEDDDLDLTVDLEDAFTLDMFLSENGTISLQAQDMPKMVYRICATDSTETNCDGISDATGGLDVDLVIDSCGRLIADSQCGSIDETTYTGDLDANGNMNIEDISIRLRTFFVAADSDGFSAQATDEGLLFFKRLIIDLTTDTVTSGSLTQTGTPVSDNQLTLVSAGIISSTVPELGGADFLAVLDGEFNTNPFNLLN